MEISTLISYETAKSKAIIVGIQTDPHNKDTTDSTLDEVAALLATLGVSVVEKIVQRRSQLSPALLIGRGKAEELAQLAQQHDAGLIVIDFPLSGPQVRNLEKITGCQVLDRSGVILDIFARHAQTAQAKTQVEIAQLEYLLPRLSGAWTHFGRQSGGGTAGRGMGETQIEIDRRRARERVSKLTRRLEQLKQCREVQSRRRRDCLRVALVGYTSSGKSTIMRGLSGKGEGGNAALFSTLDSTVRAVPGARNPAVLISDTVGFIRNLPHGLVASFKSTLEEVVSADLLLHVVDVSENNYNDQIRVTNEVLKEIGAGDIPVLYIFNKVDMVEYPLSLQILRKRFPHSISVSALNPEDLGRLKKQVLSFFEAQLHEEAFRIPLSEQDALSWVFGNCKVVEADYSADDSVVLQLRAPAADLSRLRRFALAANAPSQGE